MFTFRAAVSSSFASFMLAVSSLAQAGSDTVFDFSFLAAAPPPAPEAVPLLSNAMLLALGMLLVVIAVRTLRSNRAYRKYLSIVILGGGLVLGGLGSKETVADIASFVFGDGGGASNACADATGITYFSSPTVTNNCDKPATVTPRLVVPPAFAACYELVGGTCRALDTGETCTLPTRSVKSPSPPDCAT